MTTRKDVEVMGTREVCDMLMEQITDIDQDTIAAFLSNKVNGKAFLLLTEADLRELVPKLGERKQFVESFHMAKPVSYPGHYSYTNAWC